MKVPKLHSVIKILSGSILMVGASAGAAPILPDTETSLQQIICGLYLAESKSCRRSFNSGSDAGATWQLGGAGLLERVDNADDIFSSGRTGGRIFGDRAASFGYSLAGGESTQFSRMSLNSGHDAMVAFRGDDDSILIGHYSSGTWSKNQFLRGWNDGGSPGSDGNPLPPIIEPTLGLPEPSTLALLGLGLIGMGFLKRRQRKS